MFNFSPYFSWLSALIEDIRDPVLAIDTDYRVIAFNAALGEIGLALFGKQINLGEDMRVLLSYPPSGRELALAEWRRALAGETFAQRRAFTSQGGDLEDYELRFRPLADHEGRIIGAVQVFRNIPGSIHPGEHSREFAHLADAVPQLVWTSSPGGDNEYVNRQFVDYTGLSFEQLMGQGWHQVIHSEELPLATKAWHEAVRTGEHYQISYRFRRHDGQYRWHLGRSIPMRGPQGTITQWVGTATDVHEQHLAGQQLQALNEELSAANEEIRSTSEELLIKNEELRLSNQQLELTFQNAPSAIYLFDPDGRIQYLNEKGARLMGYGTGVELLAEKDLFRLWERVDQTYQVLGEQGQPLAVDQSATAISLRTGEAAEVTAQFVHRQTGSSFWILSKAAPVYDHKGSLHRVLNTATDITLHKTVEQVLRVNTERYATIVEASHLGLWDLDVLEGRIVVSGRMAEIFGVGANDQMTNELFLAALHPEDRAEQEALFRAILAGRAEPSFTTEHRIIQHNTGAVRWVKAVGKAFFNEAGTLYRTVGTMADITGQKSAELQVKALQEQLEAILENVASPVYLHDGQGSVLFVNRTGLEDVQSVLGQRFRAEDDLSTLLRKSTDETVFYGEDGRILLPEESALMQALRTGQPAELVYKRVQHSTGTHQWFINRVKPLHNDAGEVRLFVATHTDITQQKQSNEQLAEKNRQLTTLNTDLDNFIYTASHDLKSPIANLEGLLTLLSPKLEGKTDQTEQKMLLLMGQAVGRLKQTIVDLAEIAKVQKQTDEPSEQVRFEQVLEQVTLDLEAEIKAANAILTPRLEVATIHYPAGNLRSTLYNLISNAVKYRSPEREPRVVVHTYAQAGYTVLSVADNGLGIPAHQQHKLFTLFKRLHTHVAGTGIGLYIVKRIVENYGGHIQVESQQDQGTTFKVYFKQAP